MNKYTVCGYDMDLVHSKMLEIAVEIDRICRKYNIKYILDGGSMLGAVRHNGFIPWDHDLDVAMLREDYEKFQTACETELKERFFFSNYSTEERYSLNFGKMRMNGTHFLEMQYQNLNLHDGIFVDIFPIDNTYKIFRKLQCRLVAFVYCAHQVKNGIYDGSDFKKLIYIPFSWLSFKTLNAWRDGLMKMFNRRKTKYVYKVCHPGKKKPINNRSIYEDIIEHEFEEKNFYIPREYDDFLTKRYGEYMKIPPESEIYECCGTIVNCEL